MNNRCNFDRLACAVPEIGDNRRVLFSPGDQVDGVPVTLAKRTVCLVEAAQWCSPGALARDLGIDPALSRSLLEKLGTEGYLTSYPGVPPVGYDSVWLPEEAKDQELACWHITTKGKALAKAPIGEAIPRPVATELLARFVDRVRSVNEDADALHTIKQVTLFGSLADPSRHEVGDVDLLAFACMRGQHTSAAEAVERRMRLEQLLRAGHERVDVSVIDESYDGPDPLPEGSAAIVVFRI